jgi:hypothetical protein
VAAPVISAPLRTVTAFAPRYDKAVVEKHPRVLQVLNHKLTVKELTYTERVAYYVALHDMGGNRGRKTRKTERRVTFQDRVDLRARELLNLRAKTMAFFRNARNVRTAERTTRRNVARKHYSLDRSIIMGGEPLKVKAI